MDKSHINMSVLIFLKGDTVNLNPDYSENKPLWPMTKNDIYSLNICRTLPIWMIILENMRELKGNSAKNDPQFGLKGELLLNSRWWYIIFLEIFITKQNSLKFQLWSGQDQKSTQKLQIWGQFYGVFDYFFNQLKVVEVSNV